jgi:hypothetical protein
MHLINIKRIAFHVRDAQAAFQSPEARAYFAGQPPLLLPPMSASGTDRPRIADAVGRYLAQRGISAPVSVPAPAPSLSQMAPRQATLANPVEAVVDRFLARRAAHNPVSSGGLSGANPSSSGPANPAAPPVPSVSSPASPPPPAPEVRVVPFVSEDDVRRARFQQKKIYINAKTIVTPAARDLDDGSVLVRTE